MKSTFLLFLIFCSSSSLLFGQEVLSQDEQLNLIKKINDSIQSKEDLKGFDNLLTSGEITDVKLIASIYQAKADRQFEFIEDELYDGFTIELKSELLEILSNYDKAVEICEDCKVQYQLERYFFLGTIIQNTDTLEVLKESFLPSFELDYISLKKLGWKEEHQGSGLGLIFLAGKDKWIGGELSFFTSIIPIQRLKYNIHGKDEIIEQNIIPIGGSFLTASYVFAYERQYHDFNFSLVDLHAPIHVNATKFGFLKTSYSPNLIWYYRPEIGIGFKNISIYYAYNAVFKKTMRNLSEKHMFGVKFKFIPLRKRNNPSDRVNCYYKKKGLKSPILN